MRVFGNDLSTFSLCIHPNCFVACQKSLWDIPDPLFVVWSGVMLPWWPYHRIGSHVYRSPLVNIRNNLVFWAPFKRRSFWAESEQKRWPQRAKPQFCKLFYNGDEKTDHILRFFHRNHLKRVPLNREAANFGSTVLEGFYELSKILEISTSTIAKVHVSEISDLAVAWAQSNRFWKVSPPFLPRSIRKPCQLSARLPR